MKLLIIFFVLSSTVESLIEIEECVGLGEQRSFWEKITNGYNKKQPPNVDVIKVYVRAEIATIQNIDVNSGSTKIYLITW